MKKNENTRQQAAAKSLPVKPRVCFFDFISSGDALLGDCNSPDLVDRLEPIQTLAPRPKTSSGTGEEVFPRCF